MSRSTSPTEYSADESGYVSSRVKRTPEPSEEYDPSEDSDMATDQSLTRFATPAPKPSPQPAHGPRVRVTARKSVPVLVRSTFTIPRRDETGPFQPRDMSVTPPLATEAPTGCQIGMTPI